MEPKKQNLIRLEIFSLDEVLPFVVFSQKKNPKTNNGKLQIGVKQSYCGYNVWMTSLRYQLFASKGVTCVNCGLKGSFFALERHPGNNHASPHFNLYGIDKDGDEVLITKDHIIPSSRGGTDKLDNLQTMCYTCNWKKSDKMENT